MQIKHQVEKYIDTYAKDETQAKAMRLAVVGTGILWLILLILLAISPGFHKQKKYKTIKIMLAPVVEQQADKKVASAAAVSGSSAAASEKSEQKAVPKAQEAPAPKAAIKYKKSVEELMAEQSSNSTKKAVDWDNMNFSENTSSSSTSTSNAVAKSLDSNSALSGNAATATSGNSKVVSENTKTSAGTKASTSTSSALSGIVTQKFDSVAAQGLSSKMSNGVSLHSDGKYTMDLGDGTSRILLDPAKPYITISEENAKLIDSRRDVVISFRILAQGNVPLSGISISPSSAFPPEVQSEIKQQISKWRFAQASTDGQARFDYSIIKR